MEQKTCTKCKAVFECGANDTVTSCWCNELPKLISPVNTTDCLCPICLREKINELQQEEKLKQL